MGDPLCLRSHPSRFSISKPVFPPLPVQNITEILTYLGSSASLLTESMSWARTMGPVTQGISLFNTFLIICHQYLKLRCVNALSWAHDGELLLSGGDDTTVRLWKMDSSDTEQEYPFVCRSVIRTGHSGNIFNAQLLPYSTQL